jgi:hypothetical protein
VPLDGRSGAVALSLIAPRATAGAAARYERLILVLDVSRSIGPAGKTALGAIADAILAAAPPSAAAEAILFDRRARTAAGKLSADRAAVRKAVSSTLASATLDNGSDLGVALATVSSTLKKAGPITSAPVGDVARGVGPSTLIVIVTDGMLPLDLDSAQALSEIGPIARDEARVSTVVLVPDQASLPELTDSPLAGLAHRTGGRLLFVRPGQAAGRAPQLWSELTQPSPFDTLAVEWGGATITNATAVPPRLDSGEGLLVLSWFHGKRPAQVTVRAERGAHPVTLQARQASPLLVRATLPLALVGRPAFELLPPEALARTTSEPDPVAKAHAARVAAAQVAGSVTGDSSLVVLDTTDAFARDRLAFARKWGGAQYRRYPPPAEQKMEQQRGDAQPEAVPASPFAGRRTTGELDRTIVEHLMKQQVVPRARACYQAALRHAPSLAGSVTIEIEMARGEVQTARLAHNALPDATLAACLLDAAYDTPVPKVAIGDDRETVVVARYPLRFRRIDRGVDVSPDTNAPAIDRAGNDGPLDGLDR